jgi:hypothetical protein
MSFGGVVHSAAHIFYTVLYLSSRHGPKKEYGLFRLRIGLR